MHVLALEPYYGGSHRAFLDGWAQRSRHTFTTATLPAHKWKWRMRHASWTLADQVAAWVEQGRRWDCVLCSDMLNLPEFLGLAPTAVRTLPCVAYFHENQITYPDSRKDPRDVHFGLSNMATALAGESWFNSSFHRESFLAGLTDLLGSMPDYRAVDLVDRIRRRSRIFAPGVDACEPASERQAGPLRITWAARWDDDKNPEVFFEAIGLLADRGVDFRLSVLGEQFSQVPPVFDAGRAQFADHIDHWGFLPRREYLAALGASDVVVSTAIHEFFGISIVEAALAGAMPLLPSRLAYPEIFQLGQVAGTEEFFYDGGPADIAGRLATLAERLATHGTVWDGDRHLARRLVERFTWGELTPVLDDALEKTTRGT